MSKIKRLFVTFLIPSFLVALLIIATSLQSNVTALENKHLVFDSTQTLSEYRWNLRELNPQMPSDWSSYDFLVMEMKASSPQRFQVQVHTPEGTSRLYFHPFQNAWIRAAIPLEMFSNAPKNGNSLASLLNKQHAGYFMFNWGPYWPLNAIESISIAMQEPIGEPSLDIRSIRLAKQSPGDAVLENEPLVDPMGQWIRDEWPGKVRTMQELQEAWRQEEKELKPGNFDYCRYGGYCSTQAKATGFFRVESIDGKWWLIDPDGHLFFSAGVDTITPTVTTSIQDRASIFAELPPKQLLPARISDASSKAGFHLWNVTRRVGQEWGKPWVDLTVRRMQAWGLNTIANWSVKEITDAQRLPYTLPLKQVETQQTYLSFPDVYSEEFLANSDTLAVEQCAPRKDDPFLLGYFVRNEPPWPKNEATIVDMILAGPETATRRELQKYLATGDTPERRTAFFYRAYKRYVEVINAAIRKHDPNHLILGVRFAGYAPDEMIKASEVFDVFSLNEYEYILNKEEVDKYYRLSGRPLLIGEFHFGVPGRGLSAGLKQVRDQKERGVAYRYYVENAAAMPSVIGTHWFQWVDAPNTGRGDGENYNIGLVDVTDRPYQEMIEAMQATHRRLYAIHAGEEAPVTQKALVH